MAAIAMANTILYISNSSKIRVGIVGTLNFINAERGGVLHFLELNPLPEDGLKWV